jgi:group II intron reverse transcriptase/maturase
MFVKHLMHEAYKRVKLNKGGAGVDGITINDIESYGVDKYLSELGEELRKQEYQPQAVKRVMIDKANGGKRPLGIPTLKDRIAQTICMLIIEQIFEADFEESSYGFRPNRSSKDAIKEIKGHLQSGKTVVYDADLSKYFDTIPHDKLMKAVKERISDPRMLKLIVKWLKAPIFDDGELKGGKKNKVGTPQGGVISPLLANVYMHLIDRIVNRVGSIFHHYGISMVRYADDFVLMGKQIPKAVTDKLKNLLDRMGLILNEEKTHQINARKESFKFLGFTFRHDCDIHGRKSFYWNVFPNKQSEKKLRGKIDDYLKSHGHSNAKEVASGLNSMVRGWLNYYIIYEVSYTARSKRQLRFYLSRRIHRYYNRKSQRKCKLYGQDAYGTLVKYFGLIDPTKYALR